MKAKIKITVLLLIALYFLYNAYKIYFYTPEIDFQEIPLITLEGQKAAVDAKSSAVVVFFQTWCVPCIAEMNLVQKHFTEFNFTKIYFISDESPEKIQSLKHRFHLDSLNFLYSEKNLADIGINAFPTAFIVKDNKIIEKHKGVFIDESNFEDEIFHLKEMLK